MTSFALDAMTEARHSKLVAVYLIFERFGFGVCPRVEAPAGIAESWEFRTGCPDSATLMRCSGHSDSTAASITFSGGTSELLAT